MTLDAINRRTEHAWTQRMKLLVQVLTTFSYGSLGLAVGDPIFKSAPFGVAHLAALSFGLVCLAGALYISPEGERDGSV